MLRFFPNQGPFHSSCLHQRSTKESRNRALSAQNILKASGTLLALPTGKYAVLEFNDK